MDMNCYCSSVEMSGPPFQIASMDENGILNTWVSNMYIEKVEYSIRIIIKKSNANFAFLMRISSLQNTALLAFLMEFSSTCLT